MKNKNKGFMGLDSLIGLSILGVIMISVTCLICSYILWYKSNNDFFNVSNVMQNKLVAITKIDYWKDLNDKTEQLSDKLSVRYSLKDTEYDTEQINVIFNFGNKEYSYIIERKR